MLKEASRYANHTYMVMTLQKLVHFSSNEANDSDDEINSIGGEQRKLRNRFGVDVFQNCSSGNAETTEKKCEKYLTEGTYLSLIY